MCDVEVLSSIETVVHLFGQGTACSVRVTSQSHTIQTATRENKSDGTYLNDYCSCMNIKYIDLCKQSKFNLSYHLFESDSCLHKHTTGLYYDTSTYDYV